MYEAIDICSRTLQVFLFVLQGLLSNLSLVPAHARRPGALQTPDSGTYVGAALLPSIPARSELQYFSEKIRKTQQTQKGWRSRLSGRLKPAQVEG